MMCELCGTDDCKCPPCSCIWCRDRRGETTSEERAAIDARELAFQKAEARAELRASAGRMKTVIAQLN